MMFEEQQPSSAVPLSKIDYFIQSEAYLNNYLILPTRIEAEKRGLFDEKYDEEIKKICQELLAEAIKWQIKINGKLVENVTEKNFYQVKGLIKKKIREQIEELEEAEEEINIGELPPKVGGKK